MTKIYLRAHSTFNDALPKHPQKYSSQMSLKPSVAFNCLLNGILTPQHGTQDHASFENASLELKY